MRKSAPWVAVVTFVVVIALVVLWQSRSPRAMPAAQQTIQSMTSASTTMAATAGPKVSSATASSLPSETPGPSKADTDAYVALVYSVNSPLSVEERLAQLKVLTSAEKLTSLRADMLVRDEQAKRYNLPASRAWVVRSGWCYSSSPTKVCTDVSIGYTPESSGDEVRTIVWQYNERHWEVISDEEAKR